jgi:two-component system sensor histidine kinase/response regulator
MRNWHEVEQKDRENEILQQERAKQQNIIHILAVALLMIVALLAFAIHFYRKTVEKNRELKKLHTIKDKLFSVVAHDLRSPLAALTSLLQLANNNKLDAEKQARFLKDLSSRLSDACGLLDNLLQWAKSQMQGIIPTPVHFDAQEASRAITDSIQHIAASKKIALNNNIESHQIYTDCDMFTIVVRNLTMNAIKYTSAEGEIILASELAGDKLIISVRDNGTGMSQEVQDKLFKLSETQSQTGTNNESGTGLGLVLCADFAKINGGEIWFTSKEGEGSTFYFSVPV